MAKTLSSKTKVHHIETYAQTDDFGTNTAPLDKLYETETTTGTGSSMADLHFRDTRTLALSTSEDLDLAGGLTDAFGATLTFVKIKKIFVKAASTNGGNIVVGGAAATQFVGPFADVTDKLKIPASGMLLLTAPVSGWAVAAGSTDFLRVANDDGAASASYDIIIDGTSA